MTFLIKYDIRLMTSEILIIKLMTSHNIKLMTF